MKGAKIFISLAVCFAFCMINKISGQNLVEKGKTWVYVLAGGYPNDSPYTDLCYRIGNDTLISGIQYFKLLESYACNENNWRIRGFIRETKDSLVYYRHGQADAEYLYYDFGINVDDSVYINQQYYRLDSLGKSDLGRKVYYMSHSGKYVERWIEGVGSDIGITRDIITGGSQIFTCCLLNGGELYHNPKFNECYFTTGVNLLKEQKQLVAILVGQNGSLAINPIGGGQLEGQLQIFSLDGKLLSTERLSGIGVIEVCPRGNGILLYRFTNQKGEIQTGKVMVK